MTLSTEESWNPEDAKHSRIAISMWFAVEITREVNGRESKNAHDGFL